MSDLENLKKQAKQIQRWHHERHWPVAQQIRITPRFAAMTDREILDHDFRLADAQAVVAIRAGYANWAELRRIVEVDDAPVDRAPEPRLEYAEPCLLVSDIDRTCTYFEDKLDFAIAFTYGEPPFYAVLERDDVHIALRQVDQYILDQRALRRREEELLSANVNVTNGKALYREFVEAGATLFQRLRVEPWGRKSFIVEDPDGNLIAFHSD
jgi:uncharacterized glyoxalase superfamily protein PhnB